MTYVSWRDFAFFFPEVSFTVRAEQVDYLRSLFHFFPQVMQRRVPGIIAVIRELRVVRFDPGDEKGLPRHRPQ